MTLLEDLEQKARELADMTTFDAELDRDYAYATRPAVMLKLVAIARAAEALEVDNSDDPELIGAIFNAVRAMREP